MSSANRGPREATFAYHAQCTGFSAALTKPCCENIPGQASVSLSQVGGEAYSSVAKFDWKGLISFELASSYATGSRDHGAYNTLATVTVRNLNVANMVHADLVVARVTSKHLPHKPEGEITFAGSMIQGLVVAGEPIELDFCHSSFAANSTFDSFTRNIDALEHTSPHVSDDKTVVTSSLVRGISGSTHKVNGYSISVPEFGTIYIGQVLMRHGYRRISMLRFDLGCPIAGMAEAAGSGSNGVEYWP